MWANFPSCKTFQPESLRRVMRDVLQETAPPEAQLSDVKSPCKNAIWLPLPFTLCVGFSRSQTSLYHVAMNLQRRLGAVRREDRRIASGRVPHVNRPPSRVHRL
jgi:hypothetical protein